MLGFLEVHGTIGDDDHHVAHTHFAGGGTVEADHAGILRPFDGISLETLPIVHIQHLYFLIFNYMGVEERGEEEDVPGEFPYGA